MMNIGKRISVIALIFLVMGMFGGLLVSHMLGGSSAFSSDDGSVSKYLKEIDARIDALPPFEQAFTLVSKRVTPAVVTISSERVVQSRNVQPSIPDEFRRFFPDDFFGQQGPQRMNALGSGVIVDPGGVILTNNHVIDGADDIRVTLADRRTLDAEVVGSDSNTDLAVLRIKADDLPYVELGDSDAIEVGEWVLAIGNPFSESLRHTVTAGIVSAKGRGGIGAGGIQDFIQTDAAINPGNSGGALVNLQGELVGINTAIVTRTSQFSGVGFAIPSNLVRTIMDSLLKHGEVLRGYLGILPSDVDSDMAQAFGLDRPTGALVNQVMKDTPADKAGLERGDIITDVNGETVDDAQDLRNHIGLTPPGEMVKLTVLHNGEKRTVSVALGRNEEDARTEDNGGQPGDNTLMNNLGLSVGPLTERARQVYEDVDGVLVREVTPGSAADHAGLRPNMLITEVNGRAVSSVKDFRDAIGAAAPGSFVRVYAMQPDSEGQLAGLYFALRIPDKK